MKLVKYFTGIVAMSFFIMLFTLHACNNSTSTDPALTQQDKGKATEKPAVNIVELTQQQMAAVGILLGKVEQKNLHAVVKSSGQLAVPPQNKAEVNVLVGGIIRKINVLEGEAVARGKVVAIIENVEFIKTQQEYLTTKSSFTYTQAEFERQKELGAANAGTGKNLELVQATYNAEKAKISALEKQLLQLGIDPAAISDGNITNSVSVRAPISGTVGHIRVNTGSFAEMARPLMEIIDNSKIHCDLIVYEKDLFKVKIGQKVHCVLTNQDNQQIEGKIYGINKSFEDESKGIIVHAVINAAAKHRLIPGMYVTALIDIGSQLSDAVPAESIVRFEGKDYIYVLDETQGNSGDSSKNENRYRNLHFKRMEVISGIAELGYVQVSFPEDFPKNAQIVTKGAFYILSKAVGGVEE